MFYYGNYIPKLVNRPDFRFQPKQQLNYLGDHMDIWQYLNQFQEHIPILVDVLNSTKETGKKCLDFRTHFSTIEFNV